MNLIYIGYYKYWVTNQTNQVEHNSCINSLAAYNLLMSWD